jgi:hypothetical protein
MTKIHLQLDETDLYNALRGIIKHANADEIARVLAHCIGYSDNASNIFFKTYLGDVAPRVLPEGTMIKVFASGISYKTKVEQMKEKGLIDGAGNCTAFIKEFRGFHDSTTYYITFTNVNEDGNTYQDTGFISYKDVIEVIEEF